MMPEVLSSGSAPPSPRPHRRRADSGQAAVEAAIVLPAMIFLVLGILQLTMIQHARIMTEYAAFCAARAGIVYNADPAAMQRAAEVALMPTMTRVDSLRTFTTNGPQAIQREINQRATIGTGMPFPVVAIDILSPKPSDFNGSNAAHLDSVELDFDDIREHPVQANILQIKVRYYYKMLIPFANQMLQTIYFTQRGNAWGRWSHTGLKQGVGQAVLTNAAPHEAARIQYQAAQRAAEPQAANLVQAARKNLYYFPIQATYSMRMQSNPYLSNIDPPPSGLGSPP